MKKRRLKKRKFKTIRRQLISGQIISDIEFKFTYKMSVTAFARFLLKKDNDKGDKIIVIGKNIMADEMLKKLRIGDYIFIPLYFNKRLKYKKVIIASNIEILKKAE